MTSLRKFVLGLTICFGLPWLFLIVVPTLRYQRLSYQTYDKEKDGIDGFFPGAPIYRQGQIVYAKEGCVQCHTQMIRPSFDGIADGWKKGWGADQSPVPKEVIRPSVPRDYLGEPVALLGLQRNGPDLTNFGFRAPDDTTLHMQLYAPQAEDPWTIMPAYRHLYKVQKKEGNGSPHALPLKGEFAPEKGYEVVPTSAAVELVKYLKSLKKDAPVPGQVVADGGSK